MIAHGQMRSVTFIWSQLLGMAFPANETKAPTCPDTYDTTEKGNQTHSIFDVDNPGHCLSMQLRVSLGSQATYKYGQHLSSN